MSPLRGLAIVIIFCFPRVSGDEPRQRKEGQEAPTFSPRERG